MSAWIIETLLASSVLMLLVLAVRTPVARHFGARMAYALWLLPLLRMILPPLPAAWLGEGVRQTAPVSAAFSAMPAQAHGELDGLASIAHILMLLWLAGAALFFAAHVFAYWRFAVRGRAGAHLLTMHGSVRVESSAAIASPVAFGLLRRIVLLPEDFAARFAATEQRLALDHELRHHARLDLPANFAALAVLALHWFNPLAHIAHRAFRTDQEAACDADVLAGASDEERLTYGRALFKSATAGTPLATCAMGAQTTLKARLERIADRATSPAAPVRLALTLSAGLMLALTASVGAAPPQAVPSSAPAMPTLVLNGVTLDAPSTDAKRAHAKAERAKAEEAETQAEKHVVIQRKQFANARDASEASRAAADAVPATDAGTLPQLAAHETAKASCTSGELVQSEGGASTARVMICVTGDTEKARNAELLGALRDARKEIEDDPMIAPYIRERLLRSLEEKIRKASHQAALGRRSILGLQ